MGTSISEIVPSRVMRPILPEFSVNQMLPSDSTVIPSGLLFGLGRATGDVTIDANSPNLVSAKLREPKVAVRSRDNFPRVGSGGWYVEFGDIAIGRDATDLVAARFGEPEIAVDAEGNAPRHRV